MQTQTNLYEHSLEHGPPLVKGNGYAVEEGYDSMRHWCPRFNYNTKGRYLRAKVKERSSFLFLDISEVHIVLPVPQDAPSLDSNK